MDNIPYKENIKEIKNDPTFVESLSGRVDEIEFEEAYHPLTSKIKMTLDVKNLMMFLKRLLLLTCQFLIQTRLRFTLWILLILELIIQNQKFIFRNIGRYVYSRAARNNYELSGDDEAISAEAIKLTKRECLEILKQIILMRLCFIHFRMCAWCSKIFSKMELQNKSGEFNTFSSGIHVLSLKKGTLPFNQLILGATDTYDSLDKAVDNAFLQVEKLAASSSSEEYELLETTILNQEFDAETNELLKDMIIPKRVQV